MVLSAFGSKQEPGPVGLFQHYNLQVAVWQCQGRLSETRLRSWRAAVFLFYFKGLVWILMDRIGMKGFGASIPLVLAGNQPTLTASSDALLRRR